MPEVLDQVLPVAVFLLAITVTAEVAQLAGVFDVAAHAMARRAHHRVVVLWMMFALLAVVSTIVLSLDTTAVLLTPVGLAVARQTGIPPLPFALTTLWIANTGSLLLPVSNLTNLLAIHRFEDLGASHGDYLRIAALPASASIVVTLALIAVLQRRALRGTYAVEPPADPHDTALLVIAAVVCVAIGPLFVSGCRACPGLPGRRGGPGGRHGVASPLPPSVDPPAVADGRCVRRALRGTAYGAGRGAARLDRSRRRRRAPDALDLLHLSAVSALAANLVNNLPAYLLLEPSAAGDTNRLFATLVGVNAGALVTPWASLATLLWLQRCRSAGVRIPLARLAGLGCAVRDVVRHCGDAHHPLSRGQSLGSTGSDSSASTAKTDWCTFHSGSWPTNAVSASRPRPCSRCASWRFLPRWRSRSTSRESV